MTLCDIKSIIKGGGVVSNKDAFVTVSKQRIKELLKERGITQKELANDLDITPEHLTRCLTKGRISKTWLLAIAQYLDVSVSYLAGMSEMELTQFAELRNEALQRTDNILNELFLLLGFSSEQYKELPDYEIENLKSDFSLAIAYRLQIVRQRKDGTHE